jgi:hypothetical protein
MISAKEKEIVLVRLSDNETLNDLQNVLETYDVKSAIVRGFGNLKVIECSDRIIDAGESIIEGTVSVLDGKPYLDIYCHTQGATGKIRNFVSNNFLLTLKLFHEIQLISRKNDNGEVQLTISNETVNLAKRPEPPQVQVNPSPYQPKE